jgi:Trk-type K+ transport system membrane component
LNLLYQSFHPGWKLYQIQNEKLKIKNWINTYFPFLFGKEIKEHVIVNNWANGWMISPNIKGLTSNTNNQNNQMFDVRSLKFVAIFWPQYLEFIGFGLLVVGFLFILFYRRKIKIDSKSN